MIKIKFLMLSFFILTACSYKYSQNERIEFKHGNQLKNVNFTFSKFDYYIDKNNWEESSIFNSEEWLYYTLEKFDKDTLKNLSFYTFPNGRFKNIESYIKSYKSNGLYHEVHMRVDTFYYYTKSENDKIIFRKGWYNYMFEKGLMKSKELKYYFLNIDSLGKISGSNLPILPEIK